MRVNKAELAQVLGCSLPTVSVYMNRYGDDFPVLERGGRGRDWWFDHEQVVTFLEGKWAIEAETDAERQASLRQIALPLGHNGGPELDAAQPPIRPADMLALMKVRRMQREEAYACGRLVEAAKVSTKLEELLSCWNRELHQAVRQFGRQRGLDDDLVSDLDKTLADCQRRVVTYMRALGAAEPSDLFAHAAE